MEYNTSLKPMILREYGRNVEKLVEYIKTIEDKAKRSESAETLIELMKQVTPTIRETPETTQKMWDDLYIMAHLDLDIDAPYPVPAEEVLNKKPKRLAYSSHNIKFKHYGKNIELLVKEALKKEDPQEREEAIIYIGKLMKSFYTTWNKEVIDDSVILENIKTISGGELSIDIDKVKEDNLFEKLYTNKRKPVRPSTTGKTQDRKNTVNNNRRRRRN